MEIVKIVRESNKILLDFDHTKTNSTNGIIDLHQEVARNESDDIESWESIESQSQANKSGPESDEELDGYSLPSVAFSDSLESALSKLRSIRLKNKREEIYIPPQAKSSLQKTDIETPFPLTEKIQDFLRSECKVMLLLGDSGVGKSTFLRELEYDLWKKFVDEGRVPLLIILPEIEKPEQDLVVKHLRTLNFSDSQIAELKSSGRVTLLCDGYDETRSVSNLYMTNKLNAEDGWNAKMIITCRSTYLNQDYQMQFRPTVDRYRPMSSELFKELVVSPFSKNQIKKYVAKFVNSKKPTWTTDDYMTKITGIPGLMELVMNPFYLRMCLETLPGLVGEETDMSNVRISRLDLYDNFVNKNINVNKERQHKISAHMSYSERQAFDKCLNDGFSSSVLGFVKELAVEIYKQQDGRVVVHDMGNDDKHSWKKKLFSSDPICTILREASPLVWSGQKKKRYRFMHSSLLDYFYSLAVFDPKNSDDETDSCIQHSSVDHQSSIEGILSQRTLVNQPSILQFLAERVQQNEMFKGQLLKDITASKSVDSTNLTASNAITILVLAGTRFNGCDLSKIKIPEADLSGGYFDSCNFKDADLTNVNLFSTWIRRCDFTNTRMSGVSFGEDPYLEENSVVLSCAYFPDASAHILAVSFETGEIAIYYTNNWRRSQRSFHGHYAPVRQIAFSPTGALLVSACDDKTLRLWNFDTRATFQILKGHKGAVLDAAFSPDGNIVASAGFDESVRLWNPASGELIKVLGNNIWPVACIAFSPDGFHIATGGEDIVHCWNIETGEQVLALDDDLGNVSSIAYSPLGDKLVYGFENGTIQVYSIRRGPKDFIITNSAPVTLRGHSAKVSCLAFSPSGDQIISSGEDGTVWRWCPRNTVPGVTLYSHSPKIQTVAFSTDGSQIASGGEDKIIRLWSNNCGISRFPSDSHKKPVRYVTYSSDGRFISSVSQRGTAKIWDAEKGVVLQTIPIQRSEKDTSTQDTPVALSPDGGLFVFGKADGTIQVQTTKTGREKMTLKGHSGNILCFTFSLDGSILASGSKDKTVRIWHLPSGKSIEVLQYHGAHITAIAFSSNGGKIATATRDGRVHLWTLYPLLGPQSVMVHSDEITNLAYSADERYLLTTSMDRTIREIETMNVAKKRLFSGYAGHSKGVIGAIYIDNSKKIASFGLDATIRIWDVQTEKCLATLCEFRAQLDWSSDCDRLVVSETNVRTATDLSTSNQQLLNQRDQGIVRQKME
ncbi:hypothetical protein FBU30_004385 [Linnemannia zychae]|nr:hypothetical protein FBU30_004385 [Linnemannia zychae]